MRVALQARKLSETVWSSPNGIGELELFPNFMMGWSGPRKNRLVRPLAFTVPEGLLSSVGYVATPPEINLAEADFINRSPLLEQHERGTGEDRLVYADELSVGGAFLGHQVRATRTSGSTFDRSLDEIYGYIIDGIKQAEVDPNNLGKFLAYHGWCPELAAAGVAMTIQKTTGGNG